MTFANRAVFVGEMSVDILGLHALLVSIFTILAVADLGLSTAVMHSLFRPLEKGDSAVVAGIIRYAGTLYRRVAGFILIAGLLLLPLLPLLINVEETIDGIVGYYLVLLMNSV